MDIVLCAICAVMGYLLGNVQSAVLISKLARKPDIRTQGSHNAGSTNMLRVYGTKAGIITLLCDMCKGVIAALIGRLIGGWGADTGRLCACIASIAVIIGHDYPAFFSFKGGKGVATTIGAIFVLSAFPVATITVTLGVAVVAITGYVSAGAMTGGVLLLITGLIFVHNDIAFTIFTIIACGMLLFRHSENIKRLIKGEERKISFRKHTHGDI